MKNIYSNPTMDIKTFSCEDIVTASGDGRQIAEDALQKNEGVAARNITSVSIKDMFIF